MYYSYRLPVSHSDSLCVSQDDTVSQEIVSVSQDNSVHVLHMTLPVSHTVTLCGSHRTMGCVMLNIWDPHVPQRSLGSESRDPPPPGPHTPSQA